jgi:uncharacterized membrane protein YhfC
MLILMYVIQFLGMMLLPIIAWIFFTRRFQLSWKLVLAGGLTFIASQVLHIPLLTVLSPTLKNNSLLINAIILGLLAGIFEETARYILFKFILKNLRSWKEGILVGLGHGGTEALILGVLAATAFATMLAYRSIDLSTVPSIPANQLELAKQQVVAYWSAPTFIPLLGIVERILAMCLHVSLSLMVLYAIANKKMIWFWLAILWHALVDANAVFVSPKIGALSTEGFVAIFAIISLWIVFKLRPMFSQIDINSASTPESTSG